MLQYNVLEASHREMSDSVLISSKFSPEYPEFHYDIPTRWHC